MITQIMAALILFCALNFVGAFLAATIGAALGAASGKDIEKGAKIGLQIGVVVFYAALTVWAMTVVL